MSKKFENVKLSFRVVRSQATPNESSTVSNLTVKVEAASTDLFKLILSDKIRSVANQEHGAHIIIPLVVFM